MFTILLEVKSNSIQRRTNNFYNPASDGFKKYPRSVNGVQKAIQSLKDTLVKNKEWIEDFRFVIYEGKYQYYKEEMKPITIIDSMGNQI